ncbi:hypothetical protein [Novipirellula artificiosorum]|uniref:Uncharacterized protein n=1 Tax=Novipirellula artificiosorum TaxID=2528016 RepID=A0A5C6D206_9BACT|nr:hypothetical protein [Novipirellula artificiosorum]TWU30962.1 hypothetical protein Poly41_64310 [Novipirellula artificiosorum]
MERFCKENQAQNVPRTGDPSHPSGGRVRNVQTGCVYVIALRNVLACWILAVGMGALTTGIVAPDRLPSFLILSIFSGMIAISSLLPGLGLGVAKEAISRGQRDVNKKVDSQVEPGQAALAPLTPSELDEVAQRRIEQGAEFGRFLFAWAAAMMFRLVGTVALFLFCRYQLAEPEGWLALIVLGWYIYLTTIEVSTLARAMNFRS